MRYLFIWTVMVPGPATVVCAEEERLNGGPRAMHELRSVSREVVELSTSATCEGTLVRFVQPHAMHMMQLLHAIESDGPAVLSAEPRQVMLDVTLLGRLSNGMSADEEQNRPCWRYAESPDEAISCLICPRGEECLAHLLAPAVPPSAEVLRFRDLGMRAPLLIRRMLDMSFAAIAEREREQGFRTARRAGEPATVRREWLPIARPEMSP